jgi:lipoprotein-anchoring transpeptidase ErfK/SrfK
VIVNHERRLYFVEEVGRATRYPVAIGKRDDQWDGVETVTAKRENPTWYPPEEVQLEMDVPAVVPPGQPKSTRTSGVISRRYTVPNSWNK